VEFFPLLLLAVSSAQGLSAETVVASVALTDASDLKTVAAGMNADTVAGGNLKAPFEGFLNT